MFGGCMTFYSKVVITCQSKEAITGTSSKTKINGLGRRITGALTEEFEASQSTDGVTWNTAKHNGFFLFTHYLML